MKVFFLRQKQNEMIKSAVNEFMLGRFAHAQTKCEEHRKLTNKKQKNKTNKQTKSLESVISSYRPCVRAAYHDDCPPDFGPRIFYTVR